MSKTTEVEGLDYQIPIPVTQLKEAKRDFKAPPRFQCMAIWAADILKGCGRFLRCVR